MKTQSQRSALVTELEQVMVRQFRTLQQILEETQAERKNLLKNDADTLVKNAETKEALLDQLSLMEDRFRMLVQELALAQDLHTVNTALYEVLPTLPEEDQRRIRNLSEGMHALAHQARSMNDGNQALVLANMEWIRASQVFLLDMTLADPTYSPSGSLARMRTSSGMEIRA